MGNKMINCLCLYMRKAIPFGLQHVLAMFVANLAPVLIVCSAALVRGMVSSAGRCSDTYRVSGGKICVKGRLYSFYYIYGCRDSTYGGFLRNSGDH